MNRCMGIEMRAYVRKLTFMLLTLLVLTSCSRDPNAEANKLFVEAQQLLEKADKQDRPADKLVSLREAEEHLKSIVTNYPSSNLAVQLSSGQSVGKISLQTVANDISSVEQTACFDVPNKKCIFEQALVVVRSLEESAILFRWSSGASFVSHSGFLSAVATAQSKAGLTKAATATFDEAQEAAEKQKGNLRLYALVHVFASAGRAADALQAIQGVSDEAQQVSLLINIAMTQAFAGFHDQAVATLGNVLKLNTASGDEWSRIDRIVEIAYVKALLGASTEAGGMIDEAIRFVNADPPPPNDATRDRLEGMLMYVAEAQRKIGQTSAAGATVNRALDFSQNSRFRDADIWRMLSARPDLAGITDVKKNR